MVMPTFKLPSNACSSLSDASVKLELHCISFSHYCERARWTLRLLGIPYEEVNYLPLLHIPGILRLQRRFRTRPGPATASSKSPAATPCLAIYTATGQPLCLLQDSALICRYAVLRAAALKLPNAADLYGTSPLTLSQADERQAGTTDSPAGDAQAQNAAPGSSSSSSSSSDSSSGNMQVSGGDAHVQEWEARLGGTLGIEVRRVMYFNLLTLPSAGGALFANNSSSKLAGRILYRICRLLLPWLLSINAATAARGERRLLAEFDYFDSLLLQQQQQQQQQEPSTGSEATDVKGGSIAPQLPHYLCGPKMSIADIQLACLAGPLLCIPNELTTTWLPPLDTLPQDIRTFIQGLRERPTGKFVLDIWSTHGPKAATPAAGCATNSPMARL